MGMSYLIAGALGPIFWFIVLGTALWLVRKFTPKWERWLFAGVGALIASGIQRLQGRQARQYDGVPPPRPEKTPA